MSWARVSDRAPEHPKLIAAGAEAAWLWVCGLAYANRQDTRTGFIPASALRILYPLPTRKANRLAKLLVENGLWSEAVVGGERGFNIHDYFDWNETNEQLTANKLRARDRAKASYQRRNGVSEPNSALQSAADSARSLRDSSGSTPLHSKPSQSKPDVSDARAPAPAVPAASEETLCPPDLVERAESAGVLAALSSELKTDPAWVLSQAQEFVSYWTFGRGAGTRKAGWLHHLRQRVARRAQAGEAPPPPPPKVSDAMRIWLSNKEIHDRGQQSCVLALSKRGIVHVPLPYPIPPPKDASTRQLRALP